MRNQDTAGPLADIIDAIRGAVSTLLKEPSLPTSSETLDHLRERREDRDTEGVEKDDDKSGKPAANAQANKPAKQPKGKKDPKLREKIIQRLRKFHVPRIMRRGLRVTSVKGHVYKLIPGQTVYVMPLTKASFLKTHFLLETSKPYHLIRISSQAARSIIGSSVLRDKNGKPNTGKPKANATGQTPKPAGSKHATSVKTGVKHGTKNGGKQPHKVGVPKRKGTGVHPKKPTTPAKRKTISVGKRGNTNSKPKPTQAKKAVSKAKHRVTAKAVILFYPTVGDYIHCLGDKAGKDSASIRAATGRVRYVKDGKSVINYRHKVVVVNNSDVAVIGADNKSPRIWFVRKLNDIQ